MEPTPTAEVQVNEITNVTFVRGRGRLPSDVGSELLDVLGDVCRMVVCDLTGLAAAGTACIVEALTPASYYLRSWRGTALVVYAPEDALRQVLVQALVDEPMLVSPSIVTGTVEARTTVPRLRSVSAVLPPWPEASPLARRITLRALSEWRVDDLADASALVATELVTNAIVHAKTPLQLTMMNAGGQVRLAVRDRGGGRAAGCPDFASASAMNGRGLALVEAFTRGWGVLPARRCGKTVWAVLESARECAPALSRTA